MNLLVVDDDDVICRGFERRILSMGISQIECVYTACSAEEALQVLRGNRVDGVITDIQMVDMDGLELIARIRRHAPGIPCAIISAYDKFQYAQQAIRLGVEDFLLKPCDIEDLQAVVHKLIRRFETTDAAAGQAAGDAGRAEKDAGEKADAVSWAKRYAMASFDKDINMATVANELDMNYSYFSRLFKKETGTTFSEFMLEIKMREAGKMLLRGCRVDEITRRLGYGTTQNFTRAFAKYWGMSTREFRKRRGMGQGDFI